jgi:hypothetical protein
MATKAQLDFFSKMYDEQSERRKNIQERARFYFTIISFYLGVILFKLSDVADVSKVSKIELNFSIASSLVLSASLLFTLLEIRVRSYEIPCDPEQWINSLDDKPQSEEQFFDDRIVDFAMAIKRNRNVNAKAAGQIRIGGWLMLAAVLIQTFGLIWMSFFVHK